MSEAYDPRPAGRFRSFAGSPDKAPYTWPQDTLKIPNGFGMLPRVDALNANLARREFYGVNFLCAGSGLGQIGTITQIAPVPDDGDFWCDSLALVLNDGVGQSGPQPYSYIQIEDVTTGYRLFPDTPRVPGAITGAFSVVSDYAQNTLLPGQPFGAGQRTSFIQPYCFTRAGAIKMTLFLPATVIDPTFPMYINLAGWKEYAYAAV